MLPFAVYPWVFYDILLKNEGLQKRLNQVSKAAQGYWDRNKASVGISDTREDVCLGMIGLQASLLHQQSAATTSLLISNEESQKWHQ